MEFEEMLFCVTQLSKLSIITAMHNHTHEGKQHLKTFRLLFFLWFVIKKYFPCIWEPIKVSVPYNETFFHDDFYVNISKIKTELIEWDSWL